jgi:hypothetical protein
MRVALLPVKLSFSHWLWVERCVLELLLSVHSDPVLCSHLICMQVFRWSPTFAIKKL